MQSHAFLRCALVLRLSRGRSEFGDPGGEGAGGQMLTEPGLYFGTLRHRRFEPRRHEFTYRLFMAFLDVDRIPELTGVSRLLSYNRWNWASFDERDHFGNAQVPLRE